MIWDFDNKGLEFIADILTIALVVLVLVIIGKFIFMLTVPPKPQQPADMSFMLKSYNGLPFAFWLLFGFGLSFGLWFNGIRLVTVNCDSHNQTKQIKEENGKKK